MGIPLSWLSLFSIALGLSAFLGTLATLAVAFVVAGGRRRLGHYGLNR